MSSDVVLENLGNATLRKQFNAIRMEYYTYVEGVNPTTLCQDVEEAMYSWIGFRKYVWMSEETVDGKVYPKVAVLRGKSVRLDV